MFINLMQITVYETDGWTNRTEQVQNPTWEQIDHSIRRLDKFRYPFVLLYRDTQVEESDQPDFCVMGGGRDSVVSGMDRRICFRGQDPEIESIEVWTSDQGSSELPDFVCHEIEIVLKATRYFFERGKLYPDVSWYPDEEDTGR